MGKPKAPKTPDYAAAATAQGEANLNSALATNYLNQPNQVGPDGSLSFSYDYAGGNKLPDGTVIPRTTATTTLSPEQQKLYDQNTQISTSLNDLAQQGVGYVDKAVNSPLNPSTLPAGGAAVNPSDLQRQYDYSGVSRAPTLDDFGTQRDQVTEALMSRLQPQIDRDREAQASRLANQGINLGSEAYGWDQKIQGQNENDARMQALLAGSQEQQRLFQDAMAARQQGIGEANSQGDLYNSTGQTSFNQGLASSQYADQARQQALQEQDYFKNQPLNMLNALRTGNQVQMPQFGNVATGSQIAAAPVYAATNDQYQAELNKYQSQQSTFGALLGGLGTLGGAAIKASDRRLKENIERIGETDLGLGIYRFNYIGKPGIEIGVMADEVEKLLPQAVIRGDDGYSMVNYGMIR